MDEMKIFLGMLFYMYGTVQSAYALGEIRNLIRDQRFDAYITCGRYSKRA